MTDEELIQLINDMAQATGMGGLEVGTLYGDFALDVAKIVRKRKMKEYNIPNRENMEEAEHALKCCASTAFVKDRLDSLMTDIEVIYESAFLAGAKWAMEQMNDPEQAGD